MSDYICPKIAGTTIFFTVNLAQRGTSLLTDHIQTLRDAYHQTCRDHRFQTKAIA
ncbi:MAG: hypothetical protein AAGF30_08385 [Pseudomonadota bacterium]